MSSSECNLKTVRSCSSSAEWAVWLFLESGLYADQFVRMTIRFPVDYPAVQPELQFVDFALDGISGSHGLIQLDELLGTKWDVHTSSTLSALALVKVRLLLATLQRGPHYVSAATHAANLARCAEHMRSLESAHNPELDRLVTSFVESICLHSDAEKLGFSTSSFNERFNLFLEDFHSFAKIQKSALQ